MRIALIVLTLAFSSILAKEKTSQWIELSAASQATATYFFSIRSGDKVDPANVATVVARIRKAKQTLIDSGELISQTFKIKPPQKWNAEESNKMQRYISSLHAKYGEYTAGEMIDLGLERALNREGFKTEMHLNVSLPKGELEQFSKLVKDLVFSAEKK